MKNDDFNDDFLKKLASGYADYYGEKLKKQSETLEYSSFQPSLARIDKRIKKETNKRNYKSALIAACAAAVVLIFTALPMLKESGKTLPSADAPQAYALMQLSFPMPDEFSITEVKQDKAKTIYYLAHANNDDVVLTLEESSGGTDNSGLIKDTISGTAVQGISYSAYNLLAFEKDGVYYTLTCKYDISTLIYLSENILKKL